MTNREKMMAMYDILSLDERVAISYAIAERRRWLEEFLDESGKILLPELIDGYKKELETLNSLREVF